MFCWVLSKLFINCMYCNKKHSFMNNNCNDSIIVYLQCFDTVVGRQEEHPACKSWVMRCWCHYLYGSRCRLFAYGPAQLFSNWGPRTKGGPRRVPTGSARGFRKVVIVCTVFNNLRPMCFQISDKSVTQSVHCVEVLLWFGTTGFLLMSLSSAACDLLTTLIIGSSLLWEMMWLSVPVI